MNVKQIRENIADVTQRLQDLSDLATAENRDFTEVERANFDNDMAKVESLKSDLERAEKLEAFRADQAAKVAANAAGAATTDKPMDEAAKRFSFTRAIDGLLSGNITGLEREIAAEGAKEMRAVGGEVSGNGIVVPLAMLQRAVVAINGTAAVENQSFEQGIYANTILGELGVTRLTSTSDSRIPILGQVTTEWETETGDANDGGSALSKKDLAPRRLAAFVDYTKRAAMQHNESLEALLVSSIQQAVAAKIEKAVFTDESAAGAYKPIFDGKTAKTASTLTAVVMAIVQEVMDENQNRGNLGFAASSKLFSDLMVAAQIANVNPLVVNSQIMGAILRFSTQMAQISTKDVIYYGDWSKLQIAQFGGIEILVDPYTQATKGTTRLVLNSYFDSVLVRGGAISVGRLT
jgi:HK97 family phage major capsid protein